MTDGGGLGRERDDTTRRDRAPDTKGEEPLTRTSESNTPSSIPIRRWQAAVRGFYLGQCIVYMTSRGWYWRFRGWIGDDDPSYTLGLLARQMVVVWLERTDDTIRLDRAPRPKSNSSLTILIPRWQAAWRKATRTVPGGFKRVSTLST